MCKLVTVGLWMIALYLAWASSLNSWHISGYFGNTCLKRNFFVNAKVSIGLVTIYKNSLLMLFRT